MASKKSKSKRGNGIRVVNGGGLDFGKVVEQGTTALSARSRAAGNYRPLYVAMGGMSQGQELALNLKAGDNIDAMRARVQSAVIRGRKAGELTVPKGCAFAIRTQAEDKGLVIQCVRAAK